MVAATLTPYMNESPAPRVEVYFSSFAAGTATVTVFRLTQGRESVVRGAVRQPTAGAFTRVDNEIPFNIPVTYRAEMFDSAGVSLGFTEPATVTVPCADTWIHNPLDPRSAVKVKLGSGTAGRVSRPTPGVVTRPLGRRVGVVLSEPRGGVVGLPIDIRTVTDADADRVQALTGGYTSNTVPVVCLRLGLTDQRMRVPQPLFLSALHVDEIDINHQWVGDGGELAHTFVGDEVSPPTPGLYVALLRYKDVAARYATYKAMQADNLTYGALSRRYDLAGLGGA